MIKKNYLLLFAIFSISFAQFTQLEITLDLRSVKKNNYFIVEDFKQEIIRYFESTIFSQNDIDLNIPPINMHIVIESISEKGTNKTINGQFFLSNNYDLNIYTKEATIPYYKGKSISLTSDYNSTSSLFTYFAYILLANELDMYSPLGGTEFFNASEKISMIGRDSDYPGGWNSRLKKSKKLSENIHLRNFRFHWYEINYNFSNREEIGEEVYLSNIDKLLLELENDIYYLQEFHPNDRNAFLFLDIYSNEIGKLLGELNMFDALVALSIYDADNSSIYNQYIK